MYNDYNDDNKRLGESYDYDFEPVDQNDPYIAPKKAKKNHTAAKVTALALVCAIVGGLGGGALTTMLANRQAETSVVEQADAVPASAEAEMEAEAPETKAPAKSGEVEKTDKAGQQEAPGASLAIRSNSGEKNLSPKEVYSQNVNAVVGINVTGTTMGTNVWGYATPFAASGSGFIITEDGYVVTNNHVIEDADEITVSLYDGSSYKAELVGTYADNDVALLKVDATGLPCVTVGNSDEISVGDEVVAIGNPLGQLTFTMTVGYVSALDRSINSDGNPINMLQTDAAINSGNSGGPLFDMSGSVIGITTAKYSNNGYSSQASIEGIGFAIPINDAMRIVNDLKEYGRVTGQAYLGVTLEEMSLDSKTASAYNLPVGVYVSAVTQGSCAEKAGVKQGDIIVKFNGEDTESYDNLKSALKRCRAGDSVEMEVYRDGGTKTLQVTLDEKPEETPKQTQEQAQEQAQEQQPSQQQPSQTNPFGGYSGGDAYRFDPFEYFFGF